MKRILLTRTDRLGDVILATPALHFLAERFPEAEIDFLVRKEWIPVLNYGGLIRTVVFDPDESVSDLAGRLRARDYDAAFVLRDEALVTKAVRRAGIPLRVGPLSSLRSFFSFNRGRLQRRSKCVMHEAEYNLELVGGSNDPTRLPSARVATVPEASRRAERFLADHALEPGRFLVIHPGSSGSARYVKPGSLHALAKGWIRGGGKVLLSGGPLEGALLREFREQVPGTTLLGPEQGLGLDGLAEVYRRARTVVAHGTGPLHLAAAVGTPVLAIFPPLYVLSERRWGPLVSPRKVWVPGVYCPEKFRCAGPKCPVYDCMDRFEVNEALRSLEKLIR
jgi:ADP-heptose:LPS heptosyltransferase